MSASVNLLERLIQREVEFVIVGGYAALAHGCTLLTQDLDICCRFSFDNLLKVEAALAGLNPVHRMHPQHPPLALTESFCRGLKNLYLDTDAGVLDCLGEITGLGSFDAVVDQSISIELPFGACRLLSRDALIASKLALGRPRDIEAARQLRHIADQQSD